MKHNKKTEAAKKPKVKIIENNLFLLKFLIKKEPVLVIGEIIMSVVSNVPKQISGIILLKLIIDVVQSGTNFEHILFAVAAAAVIIILAEALNTWFFEVYHAKNSERLYFKLYVQLYEKAAKTDMAAYDDPQYYNDFVMTMRTADEEVRRILMSIKSYISCLISVLTIGSIIASIDVVCFLMIIASVLVTIPIGRLRANLTYDRRREFTAYDRERDYYMRVFYLQDYAKELRLNHVAPLIAQRYAKNADFRYNRSKFFATKNWVYGFLQEVLPMTLFITIGVVSLMGYKVLVLGTATAGDFTATFVGAQQVAHLMFYLSGWAVVRLREGGLFINKIRTFLAQEETIKDGGSKVRHDKPAVLKVENLSFQYAGTEKPVLENINLEIQPYQKVAFVGYNGAGKTTLTNLLLRLYDASEGQITLGGQNIREWDIADYRRHFTAVYQDFSIFGATLGENVAMNTDPQEQKVNAALKESGFEKEMPDGINTVLLREFSDDGVMLSGGESQKVAIARAFYNDSPFIILDEPSAALDPMSEYALNDAMVRAADNKTVIFISHRLSTTRMADVIYMFEHGRIVEQGSHEELMAMGGKYAYMFNLQAEKYVLEA